MHSSSPRPCSPANRSSRSRRWAVATAIAFVAGGVLAGCGSDKPQEQPTETAPVSVVDGRQGAGPGGANNNGKDTGDTADVPQTTAVATADTQEQIGDQSPGGGDSNGLPMGSTG